MYFSAFFPIIYLTFSIQARETKNIHDSSSIIAGGSDLGKGNDFVTGERYFNDDGENYFRLDQVKFASFNLKQFGKKKSENFEVLKIISQIIMRYDLIALQEITDVKETAIKKLIESVNQKSTNPYHYVISARVGRNKQKEQYAFMFRPNIFKVKRHGLYDDSEGDLFSREPQIAEVILKTNEEKFGIINVHVAPRNASSEIDSLTKVHSWMEKKWRLKNVIILGDLNADCDYIRKKDIPSISLLNNPSKYRWLISDKVDTTVGNTNCAYDRIIVSGPYLAKNLVANSPAAFEFDKVYGIDKKLALNVSDHYPIEFTVNVERYETTARASEKIQTSGNSSFAKDNLKFYEAFLALFSVILF